MSSNDCKCMSLETASRRENLIIIILCPECPCRALAGSSAAKRTGQGHQDQCLMPRPMNKLHGCELSQRIIVLVNYELQPGMGVAEHELGAKLKS